MYSTTYKAGLNAQSRAFIYVAIAFLLGNLSALIDAYHHPDIPYLDIEHLLVGSVTILVAGILMVLFERYLHTLAKSSRVIDAEREAAAALQEALISSSIDAFVRIDAQGRVLAWSTAAEKMFGRGCAAGAAPAASAGGRGKSIPRRYFVTGLGALADQTDGWRSPQRAG